MSIKIEVDGVSFEFPNVRAVERFAANGESILRVAGAKAKRGPGVYEAVVRTEIRESAKPKSRPLHEMSNDEFSEYANRVFNETLAKAHNGQLLAEAMNNRAKESKKRKGVK